MSTSKLGPHGTPFPNFAQAPSTPTIYRWRGKLLWRMCDPGQSNERALAVGEDCCCPPCEATCCCTDEYGNGDCLFQIRPPYCCTDEACNETPVDPNINGLYYQGGTTQIVGYYARHYVSSESFIFNNPPNDYYLSSVYTQNQPSWLSFTYCVDKARYQWHFIAGCTFKIPVCIEGYIRDPYCTAETKTNCDPCNDVFTDCCDSTLDVITSNQILATYGSQTIYHECPNCAYNVPANCNAYPPTDCRLHSGGHLLWLFDYTGCAGTVEKKCCYRTRQYKNNNYYYRRDATIASASLVGALKCDGTDNNTGYEPTQDTFDCAYAVPNIEFNNDFSTDFNSF